MEKILSRDTIMNALIPALVLVALAFVMVVAVYGMDSVIPGAHDLFHDFRHVIGMPCH